MVRLSDITSTSYAPEHSVAVAAGEVLTWSRFLADITATRYLLHEHNSANWALFEPDTYRFAVGFFALLAEDKTIYLPGENHAAMVSALQAEGTSLLGEFRSEDCLDVIADGVSASISELQLQGSIVVFTSGSTGAPKGIPKALRQIDDEVAALEQQWGGDLGAAVIAGTVSQQHVYGLYFLVCWPLAAGRAFWRRPFVDPLIMAHTLSQYAAAAWVMSPAHLHRLTAEMPWAQVRDTTRAVFSSGGPLGPNGAREIYEGLGRFPYEVLGSSETGGIAWRQQADATASWAPLPGVEVRLDEGGALAVKSPWLDDENWYVTADQATMHDSSGFTLGARLDRIVKLEGKRVSLPETEAALDLHSWVEQCRVVVVQRRRQVLGAALVLSAEGLKQHEVQGHHRFTREMRRYLGDHVASAATPRVWRVTGELPRNSQGKIRQQAVQVLFAAHKLPPILSREDFKNGCRLSLLVAPENPYFEGHFEDVSVLPGVVQLLWAQQFAEQLLELSGRFDGMRKIKFRDLVFPEQALNLLLEYEADSGQLKFQYDSDKGRYSQGILLYKLKS